MKRGNENLPRVPVGLLPLVTFQKKANLVMECKTTRQCNNKRLPASKRLPLELVRSV